MAGPRIGITCRTVRGVCTQSAVDQDYIDAVQSAGGAPLLIPIGVGGDVLRSIYDILDGLLLPGGVDVAPERYNQTRHDHLGQVDVQRDEVECQVTEWALADNLPILGICRGIQVLAVVAGGSLYQDLPSERQSDVAHEVREFGREFLSHAIDVRADSHLGRAIRCSNSRVNSFHHQAVDAVPEGFMVSARADDGVIEGLEAVNRRFVVGVQCHPEAIWRTTAPEFTWLFAAFVAATQWNRAAVESDPTILARTAS